ncbi:hypothetical protein GCM10023093_22080 [Nemorincola caseinilytica]|uniref:Uncharacterized protein n=1 Tax=Nemorincola caseinilytica TaxID=2054315 RepID=A0ABP8NIM7_9BACT
MRITYISYLFLFFIAGFVSCKKKIIDPPRTLTPKEYIPKMVGKHKMTGQYHHGCAVPGYPSDDTTITKELYYEISMMNDTDIYIKESTGEEYVCNYRFTDTTYAILGFRKMRSTGYYEDDIHYHYKEGRISSYMLEKSTFCRTEEILHSE